MEMTEIKNDMWMTCLAFMIDQLFGAGILEEWETMTEAPTLQDIAPDEEAFDINLSEWMKKLFLITEVINLKITLIQTQLEGKLFTEFTEENKAQFREHFQYQKLASAFRNLFFSIIWRLHPETQGPWNVGVRKDFKIVKAPIKIQPNIIPIQPGQMESILKQIKEGKAPGGMN